GPPTRLSSDAISVTLTQIDLTATDVEFGGLLDEPINFLHIRRMQHLDDEFLDQIIFTNYLGHGVDLELDVGFAADFADIFEVRGARREIRGEELPPIVSGDTVVLAYRGRDECLYQTQLRFAPAPAKLSRSSARLVLHLEPGESSIQEVVVYPSRKPVGRPAAPTVVDRQGTAFDARVSRTRGDTEAFVEGATRLHTDNRFIAATLRRALHDVHALR